MLVVSIIVFIILIIGAIVLGIAIGAVDACDSINNGKNYFLLMIYSHSSLG